MFVEANQLQRLIDPSRAAGGGSGLGLAIAKAIVEAQGGAIMAESSLGAGTRLIVRLPSDAGSTCR